MFGYRLRIIKKKDLHEIDVFVNSVMGLWNQCNLFIEYLDKGHFKLDGFMCSELTMRNDSIKSLLDVYMNNMYSLPSANLKIANTTDDLSATIVEVIELVTEFIKNQPPQFNDPSDKFKLMILFHTIIHYLQLIKLYINHDVIRIQSGVDIYDDYKKRKKMLSQSLSSTKDSTTVKYIISSKSDMLFKEKEKRKNEHT